ncbi:MFS transporter [Thermus tenuipuniceus]|uniref:MFS transporter n=1 Tax=Thermus tenuipuniceus TaxID=2078690 RepID=UPI0013E2CC4F|nr:MFS transporter [Thermus tenuipuniceus]
MRRGRTFGNRLARLRQGWRALEVRDYRRYFFGQLVSLTGTWMQNTAQALLVLRLSDSPGAVGLLSAAQFFPVFALALVSGVVADRTDRYRLVFRTQAGAMVLSALFALLLALGRVQLPLLYLYALVQGTVNALGQPVRRAFVADLVGPEHMANAFALNSASLNVARVLGPALAGLLIGPLGLVAVFWLNALSYLAVLWALWGMEARRRPRPVLPPGEPFWPELREGLRFLFQERELRRLTLLVAFVGTFGYNFTVILPLVGGYVLHLVDRSGAYGGLGALLGLGSLAGALGTLYGGAPGLRRIALLAAAFSLVLGAMALSHTYALSAVLFLLLGLSGVAFSTQANILAQLLAPDRLRGRVSSVFQLLFLGSTPVGSLLIAGGAHLLGVEAALLLAALLCLVGVGIALRA